VKIIYNSRIVNENTKNLPEKNENINLNQNQNIFENTSNEYRQEQMYIYNF